MGTHIPIDSGNYSIKYDPSKSTTNIYKTDNQNQEKLDKSIPGSKASKIDFSINRPGSSNIKSHSGRAIATSLNGEGSSLRASSEKGIAAAKIDNGINNSAIVELGKNARGIIQTLGINSDNNDALIQTRGGDTVTELDITGEKTITDK